ANQGCRKELLIYELAGLATCLVYRLLVPKRPVQVETVLSPRSLRSMPTLRGRSRGKSQSRSRSKSRSRTSADGDRRNLQEHGCSEKRSTDYLGERTG